MGSGQGKVNTIKGGHGQASQKRMMLLLGAGGVGKTTIVKQLTTSLGSGIPDERKLKLRTAQRETCVRRIVDIVTFSAGKEFENLSAENLPEADDWLFEKVESISDVDLASAPAEDIVRVGEDLDKMWKHPLVQELSKKEITKDHEAEISHQCADRFLPDVKRVFAADYVLSDKDALLVRCPTTQIEVTPFTYNDEEWFVKDVGGQIHLRDLWTTAFQGARTVLFIVSLADYDKFIGHDSNVNLLMESRLLFKEICAHEALISKPFVLLFNKQDLFLEKLKSTPFSVCPEFKKMSDKKSDETYEDYRDRCCKALFLYFERAYKKVLKEHAKKQGLQELDMTPIEYYQTCATDADFVENSMYAVFNSLSKLIGSLARGVGL